MTRVLRSRHAEDVGGVVVEPGQPIPDEADDDVVKRLVERGLIDDDQPAASKSKRSGKSSGSSEGE